MEPFDPGEVARVAGEFRSGRTHHTSRLWALFMYGLWRDSAGHLPRMEGEQAQAAIARADERRAEHPVAHPANGHEGVAGTMAGAVFMGGPDNGPAMTKI
jgi:hypothetical protein